MVCNDVQQGLRYVISCLVGVSELPSNQQQQLKNHAVLKRQLAQWVQVEMFSFILDAKGSDCNIERILQY